MKSFLTLQSVDQILSFINGFSPLPKEVAALDEAGLAAEAEALGITPDDVRDMARIYSK